MKGSMTSFLNANLTLISLPIFLHTLHPLPSDAIYSIHNLNKYRSCALSLYAIPHCNIHAGHTLDQMLVLLPTHGMTLRTLPLYASHTCTSHAYHSLDESLVAAICLNKCTRSARRIDTVLFLFLPANVSHIEFCVVSIPASCAFADGCAGETCGKARIASFLGLPLFGCCNPSVGFIDTMRLGRAVALFVMFGHTATSSCGSNFIFFAESCVETPKASFLGLPLFLRSTCAGHSEDCCGCTHLKIVRRSWLRIVLTVRIVTNHGGSNANSLAAMLEPTKMLHTMDCSCAICMRTTSLHVVSLAACGCLSCMALHWVHVVTWIACGCLVYMCMLWLHVIFSGACSCLGCMWLPWVHVVALAACT